jgi:hypothetical protein
MQEMRFQKHWWIEDGTDSFPLRDEWCPYARSHYYKMSMKLPDDDDLLYTPFDRSLDEPEADPYIARWDEEEWHRYYGDGIPCLGSEYIGKVCATMSDPDC